MNILAVYDDTTEKSELITGIIGTKGLCDVLVGRKRLEERALDTVQKAYPAFTWRILKTKAAFIDLEKEISNYAEDTRVLHLFSSVMASDEKKALLSYSKLLYINEVYRVTCGGQTAALMFPSIERYTSFCKKVSGGLSSAEVAKETASSFEAEGLIDLSNVEVFINAITGSLESRSFNTVKGDEYTVVKHSCDKNKIKAEYTFWHLLPDEMKPWFVMPYNYFETEDGASYTMERLHMADVATKYVHGSFSPHEFEELMDKYFRFFSIRPKKATSADECVDAARTLYADKVLSRVKALKALPAYNKIAAILESSGEQSIDDLVASYFKLKDKVEAKRFIKSKAGEIVIGHGDPCFSNALYSKAAMMLKFIDPKGALTKEEMWTDPYYDIAKLSHSVCGRYDFFNSALFDIRYDEHLHLKLDIDFDNSAYIDVFRCHAEEAGYDYWTVRLYEASLFLSMLPLHIDRPLKVLGFILNARDILKEVRQNV